MTLRRRSGSLLIITLWLVAILAVLAVAVARTLSLEVRLTKYRRAREQARALARSGIYLAMQRLAEDAAAPEPDGAVYDWLGDAWALAPSSSDGEPGRWAIAVPRDAGTGGEVAVEVWDEERRLSLNAAAAEELARLSGSETAAHTILDARDEPDAAEDRPEDQPPYLAKNSPFAAPEELADLPGMTPETLALLTAQTTPYTETTDALNLNTVSPEVLRAAGLSESAVQLVLRFREGSDGPSAHERDGIFTAPGLAILQALRDHEGADLTGTADGTLLASRRFGVTSRTFRVAAEGRTERPAARARIEAVVRREGCGAGRSAPCILAWRER